MRVSAGSIEQVGSFAAPPQRSAARTESAGSTAAAEFGSPSLAVGVADPESYLIPSDRWQELRPEVYQIYLSLSAAACATSHAMGWSDDLSPRVARGKSLVSLVDYVLYSERVERPWQEVRDVLVERFALSYDHARRRVVPGRDRPPLLAV